MIYKYKDLQRSEIEAIRKHYKPIDPVNLTETWMAVGELYGDLTYKCSIQEVAKVTIIYSLTNMHSSGMRTASFGGCH